MKIEAGLSFIETGTDSIVSVIRTNYKNDLAIVKIEHGSTLKIFCQAWSISRIKQGFRSKQFIIHDDQPYIPSYEPMTRDYVYWAIIAFLFLVLWMS